MQAVRQAHVGGGMVEARGHGGVRVLRHRRFRDKTKGDTSAAPLAPSRGRGALQKLYGHAVRSGDKSDTRTWADRHRLPAEHRALRLELGAYGVNVFNVKAEVIKALVWMCWATAGLRVAADIQDEDVGTTKLKVDAWLALLRAADHLGAEHALIKGSRCLGVSSEKVDMVESELVHHLLAVACRTKFFHAPDHFATEREEPSTLVTLMTVESQSWSPTPSSRDASTEEVGREGLCHYVWPGRASQGRTLSGRT